MEVLLVLIILVVIGSIVAPNILGFREKANVDAATTQVGFIKDAARAYWMDMNKYPPSFEDIYTKPGDTTQAEKWRGPYIDKPKGDPWGNEYQYVSPGKHNSDSFDVWSYGPDGKDGTEDDIGNWDK
jgi:general secretion pathway protein G